MARPPADIDPEKLKALMRMKPTREDVAAFFEVHPDTIENFIRKNWEIGFSEFRDQNMVHTRFMLIRTAIKKAEKGDNTMLIFCLKNLCGWRDRPIDEDDPFKSMSTKELIVLVKQKLPEIEAAG